ncbi:hypothetical protein [Herbiconiux flava]|uniref:ABC transporter n=1 Tax=Herbiconiux flava TaxID=881268 RepID=A0A852SK17_9MICO|nr:hypothetical protein [Herbiconiux flava]NYD69823.1 hypothetical protein [Herbiconiux flava]GLK16572.1 lipoprotein [Herbiconiux flava]
MSTSFIPIRRSAVVVSALLAVIGLTLAGCTSPPSATDRAPASTAGDGHGFVAGAAEMPEPQLRLITLGETGLQAFDPATGDSVALLDEAQGALSSDGRYAVVTEPDGRATVVDTGTWTVPHGDHSHYYLAEPRSLGRLDDRADAGPARLASSTTLTAVSLPGAGDSSAGEGLGIVLDGEALADGRLEERARIPLAAGGALLPLEDLLVGPAPDSENVEAGALASYSADGIRLDVEADCAAPAGAELTRVGAAFSCADGAVLATAETGGGSIRFERIPYPDDIADGDRAMSFAGRPGRPDVAAVAGGRGAWLLDTRDRRWTLLPSPAPLLRATAVGDADGTVVGVDVEGRIVVLDAQSAGDGAAPARSEPVLAAEIVDGQVPAELVFEVDADRAYVNAPSAGTVLEIDYRDRARIARTLDIPGGAAALAEVG